MEPKKIHNNPGLLHAATSPWAQARPWAAGAGGRLLLCCYYTPCTGYWSWLLHAAFIYQFIMVHVLLINEY
jgi:hypothetical protein